MTGLQPGTTMYRIAELERVTRELREELRGALERIRELEAGAAMAEQEERDDLDVLNRIAALERSTPKARQAQYEADVAAADLAGSGYGESW